MKQTIQERLRRWMILKLGGIDRGDAIAFAERYLVAKEGETIGMDTLINRELPNGGAIIGKYATVTNSEIGARLVVAPWAQYVNISNCYFP